MALTIGIVGLPNVGKSTLFNALTRAQVLAANYPFATIEPNIGVVPLPDPRLGVLAELFHSERIMPATVSFVDIAGIVRHDLEALGIASRYAKDPSQLVLLRARLAKAAGCDGVVCAGTEARAVKAACGRLFDFRVTIRFSVEDKAS